MAGVADRDTRQEANVLGRKPDRLDGTTGSKMLAKAERDPLEVASLMVLYCKTADRLPVNDLEGPM